MNRTIKFRYRLRNIKTGEDYPVVSYKDISEIENGDIKLIINDEFYIVLREEFTGLHDKNGKEIFEGDIVKEHNRISEITYCAPTFRQCGKNTNKVMCDLSSVSLEVIGNIYENKELLT